MKEKTPIRGNDKSPNKDKHNNLGSNDPHSLSPPKQSEQAAKEKNLQAEKFKQIQIQNGIDAKKTDD